MSTQRRRYGTLYKRDKIYWTRFRFHGLDVRQSTGTSDKERALAMLEQRWVFLRYMLGLRLPEEGMV